MAIPFGQRAREIRKALGLQQDTVRERTGINQPRLSKIETGKEDASADVIEKLAEAYGRDPVDFVRGTNREGHYTAQRLRPEQREELERQKRLLNATHLEFLYMGYSRICDFFDALYGSGIIPAFRGEELYIHLRQVCEKALAKVDQFLPAFSEQVHFPDHIEPEGEMDDQVLGWDLEAPYLRKSLRAIQTAMYAYRDLYSDEERAFLVSHFGLDKVDEKIAELRAARIKVTRLIERRIDEMAKSRESADDPGPG